MTDRSQRIEAVVATPPFSRISWGSIIAGTLCAFALQLLLNLVGLGLGLSAANLSESNVRTFGIGAGIWWGVAAIVSLVVGGWIAGRLAGVPIRLTAALHGASVWALVTLLTVWLATTTLATAVSGAFGAVGQVGRAAATAVGGVARTVDLPDLPANLLGEGTSVAAAGERRASVMRSIRNEARELFRSVVSQQEQQQAAAAVRSTAGDILRTPQNFNRDLNGLIDTLFRSEGGVFGEEDVAQARGLLQERFGLTADEAAEILTNWQERYRAAVGEVDAAVAALEARADELRTEATEAAKEAADAVGAAAGWTALALTLGLLAAVLGGLLGKPDPYEVELADDNAPPAG